MAENKKLVPKRRFKGFAGDWEQREFKNVFDFLQNNALSRADLSDEEGAVLDVHYGDILVNFGEVIDIEKDELPSIVDESIVKKYTSSLLQNGDVIIADAAEDETVGKCSEIKGLSDKIVLAGLHTIPVRPKEKYACGYLGYYMNSSSYHNQLLPLMQGTKVSSISKSAIQDTDILYPKSEAEQQQIGSYFKHLDNLITLHQRKLEKTKALKSAYLSEMFPQEGESVPKRRFKGFTGDWERRKLGEVADIVRGASPRPIQDAKWFDNNSDVGWLRIADVTEQNGRIYHLEQRISKLGQEKTRVLIEPNLLLSIAATVGKPVVNYVKTGVHDGFLIFQNLECDREFMFQWLEMFRPNWQKYGQPGSQVNLNSDLVKNQEVLMPYSENEQTQIGTFFAHLDNLITHHQRKLEKLQDIKKAYLNEMFI